MSSLVAEELETASECPIAALDLALQIELLLVKGLKLDKINQQMFTLTSILSKIYSKLF